MTGAKHTKLLWLAGSFMLLANLFFATPGISAHYGFPVNLYYSAQAIAIFLFHLFIFVNFKKYLITFLLLGLSVNSLFDELFFDPTKLQLNELVFAVLILIFGIIRQRAIRRDVEAFTNGDIRHNNGSFRNDNQSQKR